MTNMSNTKHLVIRSVWSDTIPCTGRHQGGGGTKVCEEAASGYARRQRAGM